MVNLESMNDKKQTEDTSKMLYESWIIDSIEEEVQQTEEEQNEDF